MILNSIPSSSQQKNQSNLTLFFHNRNLTNTSWKPHERSNERRRKQSQPRKVLHHESIIKEEPVSPSQYINNNKNDLETEYLTQIKNLRINQRYLKCFSCPDGAPARGEISSPYHTKASLVLHKLWKHKVFGNRKVWTRPVEETRHSITLKATVFTNASFDYRR